jgi:hypothetical protein
LCTAQPKKNSNWLHFVQPRSEKFRKPNARMDWILYYAVQSDISGICEHKQLLTSRNENWIGVFIKENRHWGKRK